MAEMLPAFACPCCGKQSCHPSDIEHGYCGLCHWWTGDPLLGPPHLQEPCAAQGDKQAEQIALETDILAVLDDYLHG